jgi:competence protein ComEA
MKFLLILFLPLAVAVALLPAQQDVLPEGEGKKVVEKLCNDCHGPENYTSKKHTKEEWEKVIQDMVEKGASGTDKELDTVVAYLTKYFGKPQ